MSKFDEIKRTLGGNVSDSFGTGAPVSPLPPGMDVGDARRMPARLMGVAKAKDAAVIPTDRIQPDPDQPREDFDAESLDRLAASLRTRGQLQPIRVRWDEGRGAYVIVSGERRWRAAVQAGLPSLTCMVHDAPLNAAELLAVQLVENALREDLKPVEQAKAYRKLMELHGWSGNQLAKELSIDQSGVSRAMSLLDLPEPVQARIDAGELGVRVAADISRLEDPAEQLALAERAASGELTREQVQATVKARKLGKAKAEPPAKVEFKFDDGGKLTVTLPPGMAGMAAVVEMLQRGLKKARAELKQVGPSQAA
jgi:ParB family transcriptional regulator, chromosome partitioning protein